MNFQSSIPSSTPMLRTLLFGPMTQALPLILTSHISQHRVDAQQFAQIDSGFFLQSAANMVIRNHQMIRQVNEQL